MDQLEGSERLILQAILDSRISSAGFAEGSKIAEISKTSLEDVEAWLTTLEGKGFVELAKQIGGFSAHLTAKGALALRRSLTAEIASVGDSRQTMIKVIPKGLRSYDKDDAGFFLDLLPPPRHPDDGLPKSVHFWKTRIEETDPDKTFKVGVIYGPSGCGKSSLVKAGLLPRLTGVRTVYVEATSDDTEARLLKTLQRCPDVPRNLGLVESIASLTEGKANPASQKVLIVLDQFEQWLHANAVQDEAELIAALRQCDGEHVQAIVLVRDDYWMATSGFFDRLAVVLRSDLNFSGVDRFDQRHARKVLAAFGLAYGSLGDRLTDEQEQFLNQAVEELVEDRGVSPVRLALMVELFWTKKWEWSPRFLNKIGGIQGVGIKFLEETFESHHADPRYRQRCKAVQKVLSALLPDRITDIKGQMRSYGDLFQVSGYGNKKRKFDDLLQILDIETHLITPTEPWDSIEEDTKPTGERYYQLAHDYLVPSLREWLSNTDQLSFDSLYERLLESGPTEMAQLLVALKPHRDKLVERLWKVFEQSERGKYLQAASALAMYDPADTRWQTIGDRVAKAMITVNAVHLGFWLHNLRPARDKLVAPLATIYLDRESPETERSLAFNILDDYASYQPHVLAKLLIESDENYFAQFFEKLKSQVEADVVAVLEAEAIKPLPETTEVEKYGLAKRQAKAAVAMVRLGRTEKIWPPLRHSPDPTLRNYLVNWLAPLGAEPKLIVAAFDRLPITAKPTPDPGQQLMDAVLFHPETSIRRALILALGAYNLKSFSAGDREPLIGKLLDLYRNDPDAGIHGAAEWTLRQWKNEAELKRIDAELSKCKDWGERRWFVNRQGQTFAVIEGPVEFLMGSPPTEPNRDGDETQHQVIIPRRFAIAAKEVSKEQWKAFVKKNPDWDVSAGEVNNYSSDTDGPMSGLSWYAAAAYCNWLSEQEGLPKDQWCYLPAENGKYMEGMTIPADVLQRKGYRIPTEAEWEYACRSGITTDRYYGDAPDLLDEYSRNESNSKNHAWSCGSLRPNDLGLFDMLGNLWEWVQDNYQMPHAGETKIKTDEINTLAYLNDNPRLLRGGAFDDPPAFVRSAVRDWGAPAVRFIDFGFRPSRTYY